MIFRKATDIKKRIEAILTRIDFAHVRLKQIVCVRSTGSSSRARARIWAFPTVWQVALGIKPHYVIEVLSERFDRLPSQDQTKVLIHELLHIPKTFSGALRPHRMKHFQLHRELEKVYRQYASAKRESKCD